jgi:DNA-binding LacI/PurR family transcriptional regulator
LTKNEEIKNLLGQISNVVIVVPSATDFGKDVLVLDRKQPIRDIVDHFVGKGRKKIVFFNSIEKMSDNAFLEQLKSHGLYNLDKHVFHLTGQWLEKEQLIGNVFLDTFQQATGGEITFDAVITSCDEGAVALTNYFIEQGYKVPEDVAVAGFNDSSMGAYLRPPLATVNRCDTELAKTVTEMLLNRIKNPKMVKQHKLIEMKFICRESAG